MDKIVKRIKTAIISSIICVLFLSFNIFAEDKHKLTLKIGVSEENKILLEKDSDQESYGYLADYIRTLLNYTPSHSFDDIRISYIHRGNEDVLVEMLQNGQIDLFPTSRTFKDRDFLYTKPVATFELYLFTGIENNLYYENYINFNGKTIGITNSEYKDIVLDYAKIHNITLNVKEYPYYADLGTKLKNREIDMGLSILPNIDSKNKILDVLGQTHIRFAVSKENSELYNIIMAAQSELKLHLSNALDKLKEYYFIKDISIKDAYSVEEDAYVKAGKPIRVAMVSENVSESLKNKQEIILDIVSDIVNINHKIVYYDSVVEARNAVINGEADAMTDAYKTEALLSNKNVMPTDGYMTNTLNYFVKKDRIVNKDDRLVAAIGRESVDLQLLVSESFPNWKIELYDDLSSSFDSVEEGISDVVVCDAVFDAVEISNLDLDNFRNAQFRPYSADVCIIISKKADKAPVLFSILNKNIKLSKDKNLSNVFVKDGFKDLTLPSLILKYKESIMFFIIIILISIVILFIKFQQRLYKEAYFDSITKLYNRNYINVHGKHIQRNAKFSVIIYDISGMKRIESLYGSKTSDKISKFVASELVKLYPKGTFIARNHSMNFIVILKTTDDNVINDYIEKTFSKLQIFKEDKVYTKLDFHVGIYKSKKNESLLECISKAETALINGKNRKQKVQYFDQEFFEKQKKEKMIEDIMEKALSDNQFCLYYQPKFSGKTGEICGAEALIRWIRADGTVIYPDEFIYLFERNGFILQIDDFVLQTVCRLQRKIIDKGKLPVPISVNHSRLHIERTEYLQSIIDTVDAYEIPHNLIDFEVTEYVYSNFDKIVPTISNLKSRGFSVSLDDFGSGYSSFSLLKKGSFNYIKIDKSFLTEDNPSEDTKAILNGIINMSKALNIKTVCEGVETEEQVNYLKIIGCNQIQGYYCSKPLSEEEFLKMVFGIEEETEKK